MRNANWSKKTYLIVFVFVMTLNGFLAVFLWQNVLANSETKTFKNQPPIAATVDKQTDSPLVITIAGIDNSNENYQTLRYTLQNTAGKPVKGYVILGGYENSRKILTNFLPAKALQPNAFAEGELAVERENVKPDKPVSLAVDYVEFEDGSAWGTDSGGQSEHISGGRAGADAAAGQFITLIEKNETAALADLMKKQLAEVEVPLPEASKIKSEKWLRGFQQGYKSIVGFLQSRQDKGNDENLTKLGEIRKNLRIERRQK